MYFPVSFFPLFERGVDCSLGNPAQRLLPHDRCLWQLCHTEVLRVRLPRPEDPACEQGKSFT
jgi:hypothetical protein